LIESEMGVSVALSKVELARVVIDENYVLLMEISTSHSSRGKYSFSNTEIVRS